MVSVCQSEAPLWGIFLDRPNRFRMEVELETGRKVEAYCPNPGRMEELFTGGERVSLRLAPSRPPGAAPRVTTHDVLGVRYRGRWVSVDTRLPNALVGAALEVGAIPELEGYRVKRAEHTWGRSRIDFLLQPRAAAASNGGLGRLTGRPRPSVPPALLEVKSCTLVEEGIARFPDAPTLRGARHLRELAEACKIGLGAYAFFCIQRDDARLWRPHHEMDQNFASACLEAKRAGVILLAYNCDFDGVRLTLGEGVPVDLSRV